MKISASIYSDKSNDLATTIENLNQAHVELLHVDCNDDLSVFEDIKKIREITDLPVDLHIITDDAGKYTQLLREVPVEYVTFQYEDLTEKDFKLPENFKGKVGLSITSNTSIDAFQEFDDVADFILIMATIPGQSGGVFDKQNFQKIRNFQSRWPNKRVHVDGGVNAEVSFILRNMGVYASVSGSYLFKANTIDSALMNLKLQETESHYQVQDFMRDITDSPVISMDDLNLKSCIETMNIGKLGFVMVVDSSNKLKGIIGNADLRNGILKHIDDLNSVNVNEFINSTPVVVQNDQSVSELLRQIKKYTFPVLYMPVVDKENKAVGTVSFMNLIKGEL